VASLQGGIKAGRFVPRSFTKQAAAWPGQTATTRGAHASWTGSCVWFDRLNSWA